MNTFVILAAGNSTRFGGNKLLEPISGLTLPQRCALFAEANGAKRVCVTVNRNAVRTNGSDVFHPVIEDIKAVLKDPSIVEISFQSSDSYGPGAAITAWEGKLVDDFTVLFGDNLYEGIIPELDPTKTHFSYRSLSSNPRNLQLAAVVNGFVVEKPHAFLEGDFFCGFVHFPAGFFSKLPALQKSSRGEYEITDMINMLSPAIPLSLDDLKIKWADITYKVDIERLEALVS